MKKCTKCNEIKDIGMFSKDMNTKDNLSYSCKECKKVIYVKWNSENKEKVRDYNRTYRLNNKDSLNSKRRDYEKDKRNSDINYKLSENLRTRLYLAIKNSTKSGSAVRDLGCSLDFLKQYLETMFQPGMSWANYGQWHIDHIFPLSKANLSNREELLKVCNFTNLQPLWAIDNVIKSNKIV